MSVETQISRIKANIASAYAKAAEKGAELPAVQSSENLPGTIEGIPAGGLPEGVHTITVAADPPEDGIVSGGGVASEGMTVTVHSTPKDDCKFQNWSVSGAVVSNSPDYTFSVVSDIIVTSNFKEPIIGIPGRDWWKIDTLASVNFGTCAYGGDKFVIAARDGKMLYSSDGINWNISDSVSPASVVKIVYGADRFVAITSNNTKAMYSLDGVTWHESTINITGSDISWSDLCYGNGKFVAVNGGTDSVVAYTTDGITWNSPGFSTNSFYKCVAYGGGKYLAIGQWDSSSKYFETMYSENGTTWTRKPISSTGSIVQDTLAYGAGKFVSLGTKFMYSANGTSWTLNNKPLNISNIWSSLIYTDKFEAFCSSNNYSIHSADGVTWTKQYLLDPTNSQYKEAIQSGALSSVAISGPDIVVYGGGVYVGVSDSNQHKIFYSGAKEPD